MEIRVAGFGGQGVISMGYILGKAVSIHEGRYSLTTSSYGPEARGGACRADIIISDSPIDYPKVSRPDCLVAMSVEAYSLFHGDARDGGSIIYEDSLLSIDEGRDARVKYYGVPAIQTARDLGSPISANMVMLGALLEITHAASPGAVKESIRERFPRFANVNLEAMERGMDLIKN